jgi:cysteinyl-tRNA synthetase
MAKRAAGKTAHRAIAGSETASQPSAAAGARFSSEVTVDLRQHNLHVYNTLTRQREKFEPLDPPRVGLYVCGPTVYGDAHIGHAKSYVSFDVIVRYLRYLGYRVTYVQNITDVGHLTDDADQGEDKVERKARAERVHPMAVAEMYTRRYFEDMDRLSIWRPDISPRASGHIIEQIELVKRLLANGHAYEAGGSVYFDVASWPKYGKLSGRTVGEMQAGARVEVSAEKRHAADFALWKRAEAGHIMQWPSPWGMGFPGWHLECSAMSMKYLGESFDIHGGGIENQFPHHEDEIAQAEAATGQPFVRYWLHNNMVTVNGQKMGKSLGNFITLREAIGTSEKPGKWDPMVLRMFILQSHYRSPLDFSDEALNAAKEGYDHLKRAAESLRKQVVTADETIAQTFHGAVRDRIDAIVAQFEEAMQDDFNTAAALGSLQELRREANRLVGEADVPPGCLHLLAGLFRDLGYKVLGLSDLHFGTAYHINVSDGLGMSDARTTTLGETAMNASAQAREVISTAAAAGVIVTLIDAHDKTIQAWVHQRDEARKAKNFALADDIRKRLDEIGIILEDTPEGTKWRFK